MWATIIEREDGHIVESTLIYKDKSDLINIIKDYNLVGLAGPATVGKSFLADELKDNFEKYSIAKRLKNSTHNWITSNLGFEKLKELQKDKEAIRPFYNKIGELLRLADPGYYVKDIKLANSQRRIIVDDLATKEECEEIRKAGGVVLFLDRANEVLIQSTRPVPHVDDCCHYINLGRKMKI